MYPLLELWVAGRAYELDHAFEILGDDNFGWWWLRLWLVLIQPIALWTPLLPGTQALLSLVWLLIIGSILIKPISSIVELLP